MTVSPASKAYVIDSANEAERLEAQARLAGIEGHLARLALPERGVVLDVGCGSGSMARLIARAHPGLEVVGIDSNASYLDFAERLRRAEGLDNLRFEEGDAFALPFDDGAVDVVWSKYLLQWLETPQDAVDEMARVTRTGGRVVAATIDGFGVSHHPVAAEFLADAARFFGACVDPFIGRKLYGLFHAAGLGEVEIQMEADRLFTIAGAIDPERRKNWEVQMTAAFPVMVRVFGGEAAGRAFYDRLFAVFDDPAVFSHCVLYTVSARRG